MRNLYSVTGPKHQISATCNATFSSIASQVAEKLRSVTGPLAMNGYSSKILKVSSLSLFCSLFWYMLKQITFSCVSVIVGKQYVSP